MKLSDSAGLSSSAPGCDGLESGSGPAWREGRNHTVARSLLTQQRREKREELTLNVPRQVPDFFNYLQTETKGMEEHTWENKKHPHWSKRVFAPKVIVSYRFIVKRVRTLWPHNCFDDTADAEDKGHGVKSHEHHYHASSTSPALSPRCPYFKKEGSQALPHSLLSVTHHVQLAKTLPTPVSISLKTGSATQDTS